MATKLTDRFLAGLKVPQGKKDMMVADTVVRGLFVRVGFAGGKVFLVQHTDAAGQKVRQSLGSWGAITVNQARTAAQAVLGKLAAGVDLRAERQARREKIEREKSETSLTFGAIVDEWVEIHLTHRQPKYAREAVRALRYSLADLMDKPAARITRADAVNALDKIARGGAVAMAGRVMAYARAAYRWAERRGKVPANPFADLPVSAGITQRDRVLSDDEMRRVWQAMGELGYPFGPLFQLMALTLVRENEATGARWEEFDGTTWTVPKERTKKARADHVVALSESARELIRSIPRVAGWDLVFTTTGTTAVSGFSKAKERLDKLSGVTGWVLHDLRRTGVSKLAELGYDPVLTDKLLDHQPESMTAVARIYQRYSFATEQAKMLSVWGDWLAGKPVGEKVVKLRVA
jgi:integrase